MGCATRRLFPLIELVPALGSGALHRRVHVSGPVEIEEVAQAFNLMAQRLEDRDRRVHEESGRAKLAADAAEGESRRLQVTVDTMPEGVFLAEAPGGEVVMANKTARRLLGRELPEGTAIDLEAARYGLFRPDGTPTPPRSCHCRGRCAAKW
ncbi:MAG: HAMP domain-containing protein [Myxococcaceae bacterium]